MPVIMVRFRSKSARATERGSSGEAQMPYERTLQAASVGSKTRSAGAIGRFKRKEDAHLGMCAFCFAKMKEV